MSASDDSHNCLMPRWSKLAMLGLVAAVAIGLGCGAAEKHDATFHQARAALVSGDFELAVKKFEEYQRLAPQGRFGSRAGLLLGKAYLGLDKLADARRVFEATAKDFGQTEEGHKCRYKLALVDLLEGKQAAALEKFQALADKPDGPLAPEAAAMARYLKAAAGPAEKEE